MHMFRPAIAIHPLQFGRRAAVAEQAAAPGGADDLRLFATSFAAGFLFVSVLIF